MAPPALLRRLGRFGPVHANCILASVRVVGLDNPVRRSAVLPLLLACASAALFLAASCAGEREEARRAEPPAGVEEARDGFPPGESGYHDYGELSAEVRRAAEANPDAVRRFSIGESYEGREIWAAKVSDNPGVDENEPEVLFVGLIHGREHLSAEMALYALRLFAEGRRTDPRIRRLVDSREVWVVPAANPDGAEQDVAGGYYHRWRKNRQPNGSLYPGTDLNRNFGYMWGCCRGLSSDDPGNRFYRGPRPFSAPETAALRDFVKGRVVGGRQQIRTVLDFHSSGEAVLWPYSYTLADVPPVGMAQADHEAFVAMGEAMASTNGYAARQMSDMYVHDGTFADWAYGAHGIFAYEFELYPDGPEPVFYPPDDVVIARETERNREAVLYIAEQADCPYRSIDKESQYCGAAPTVGFTTSEVG